jgi:hypothetical protein
MAMVDLKKSYGAPETDDDGYYPSICIDGEQIKQLGIAETPVGSLMTMTATVCLCRRTEDDDSGMRIEFEINEASFAMKEKPKSASSILFPDD